MNGPAKSYELTFEEREGYLYAFIKADTVDEQIATSYLREVADRCAEIKCKRLMIHRDISVMLDNITLFFVTNAFAEWTRGIRTAFVNPHISIADAMNFAILIGTNGGADHFVFNNVADAEEWLLK